MSLPAAPVPVPLPAVCLGSVCFRVRVLFQAVGVIAGEIDRRVIERNLDLIGALPACPLRGGREGGWGRFQG